MYKEPLTVLQIYNMQRLLYCNWIHSISCTFPMRYHIVHTVPLFNWKCFVQVLSIRESNYKNETKLKNQSKIDMTISIGNSMNILIHLITFLLFSVDQYMLELYAYLPIQFIKVSSMSTKYCHQVYPKQFCSMAYRSDLPR